MHWRYCSLALSHPRYANHCSASDSIAYTCLHPANSTYLPLTCHGIRVITTSKEGIWWWSVSGGMTKAHWARCCFNIKTVFPGIEISIKNIKTVMKLSYLFKGSSYSGNMAYLYWNAALCHAFSGIKIMIFWIKFHWYVFLAILLMMNQY